MVDKNNTHAKENAKRTKKQKVLDGLEDVEKEVALKDWRDGSAKRGTTVTTPMIDKVRFIIGNHIRMLKDSPTQGFSLSFCRLCFQPDSTIDAQPFFLADYQWYNFANHLIDCPGFRSFPDLNVADIKEALKDKAAPHDIRKERELLRLKSQPSPTFNGSISQRRKISSSPAGRDLYTVSDLINSKATTLYSTGKMTRDIFDTTEMEEYATAFRQLAPGEKLHHSNYVD